MSGLKWDVPPPDHGQYMASLPPCKACRSTDITISATQDIRLGRAVGDGDLIDMIAECLKCGFRFEVPTAEQVFK